MPENPTIRDFPRDLIEKILKDPGFVRLFESIMRGVGETLPENIEIAQDTADQALAATQPAESEQEREPATQSPEFEKELEPGTQELDWFDICHPVGCTVIRDDSLNPGDVYGRGVWSQINAGKFLVVYQAGDPDFGTIGATGGSKTITIDDHAHHTHDTTASATVNVAGVTSGTDFDAVTGLTPTPATSTIETPTLAHESSGVSPIETLPPFQVIALWKRTA